MESKRSGKHGVTQTPEIRAEWHPSPSPRSNKSWLSASGWPKAPNLTHILLLMWQSLAPRVGMPRSHPGAGKGLNRQTQTSCETKHCFILWGFFFFFLISGMWTQPAIAPSKWIKPCDLGRLHGSAGKMINVSDLKREMIIPWMWQVTPETPQNACGDDEECVRDTRKAAGSTGWWVQVFLTVSYSRTRPGCFGDWATGVRDLFPCC